MGFWSRAGSRLLNMVRRRDDPSRYFQWIGLDAPAGIVITPQNALELSVVWACVMAITNGIAPSRWNVFAEIGKRRQRLPDDALDYLLNVRPNADMTAISFRESLMIAVLTWGNGYAEIVKNARGQPSELWPLLPDRVIPRRRTVKPYRLYYDYLYMDGSRAELEPEQVFHLRGPGISGLMGDNLVARAAKAMSLAAAQERFASTYFGNNTNLGGVLKTAKKLQPDTHARLKKDWEDQHKGPFKANRPTVLEDGMEWVPSNNDAEKAQLTGSRTFQVEEVCRFYGVPPHKVQHLLRATFNNIEHLGIEFVRDALTPWARRNEQEADFKLFPKSGQRRTTTIDMAWLTHGDAKSRMEAHKIGRDMGVYSANDILAMEGKDGIGPVGDMRIVPLNMTTDERMLEGPPDPAPVPPVAAPGSGKDGSGSSGGGDGNGEGDAGTGTPGEDSGAFNSVAREAVVTVFASIFERYEKRLENREADLRRGKRAEDQIAVHMADERARLRSVVLEEARPGLALLARGNAAQPPDIALLLMLDEIDHGTDARAAAERLVATCAPEPLTPRAGASRRAA